MSLATRCTSCGTIFRVVQDQLKVSDGWVRCGRCNEVFNAMEGLFDLQREAPQRARGDPPAAPAGSGTTREAPRPGSWPTADGAPAPSSLTWARPAPVGIASEDEAALGDTAVAKVMRELATHEHGAITKGQSAAVAGVPSPPPRPPARGPSARGAPEWRDPEDENVSILPADDLHPAFADATFPESVVAGVEPAETLPSAIEPSQLESQTTRPRPPSRPRPSSRSSSRSSRSRSSRSRSSRSSEQAAPGFLRKAAQEARWRRPWVRALLLLVVLALNAVLAGQMAYHWRDRVAAQWPGARPWLAAACSVFNCQLQPPRAIDAIVVESTTLTRLDGVPEGYRLTVVLRNRAAYEVLQPYLDLSLTDGDGLVVARRALTPGDFRARPAVLPQQSETALQLAMVIEGHRVAGYTVAAFYP
jgi:predicted Zn finger-like uncharacterized protein